MSKMDNFFVYLSSENVRDQNVSKAVAGNTLPLQIDTVDKQWEVSLVKSAITHNWGNAVDIYISATRIEEDGTKNVKSFKIEDSFYSKTENLYEKINQKLSDLLQPNDSPHNWFKFGLAGKGQALYFKVAKNVKFEISRELQLMLNLKKNLYDNTNNQADLLVKPPVSETLEDISSYQRNIFITCDNIEPVFVNKKMTGILGDVQVKSDTADYGDILANSHTPRYFRWMSNSASEIKVEFRDEFLHLLQMPSGNSFVLLHFRQCK